MPTRKWIFGCLCATAIGTLIALSCTDDDGDGLYRLSDAVDNPTQVTLNSGIGVLRTVSDADKMPSKPASELLEMLQDGTISLVVKNTESGVTAELTQGKLVGETPAAAGEYQVTMNDEGVVEVRFYNEFKGSSIRTDGNYTALVDVAQNDYFEKELFDRGVKVTN